jgi:hypothetical protein
MEMNAARTDFRSLCGAALIVVLAIAVCGAGRHAKAPTNSARAICSARAVGLAAVVLAALSLVRAIGTVWAPGFRADSDVTFLAPVQQAGSALTVEVSNVSELAETGTGYMGLARRLLALARGFLRGRIGLDSQEIPLQFSAGRCWRGRRCAGRTARRHFLSWSPRS